MLKKILILVICLCPTIAWGEDFFFNKADSAVKIELKNGKLEITYRAYSQSVYAIVCNTPGCAQPPDRIWKEIYIAKDGKIVLEKELQGTHIPAQTIPEKIVFEEKE